jgi:peptide/nickel transport system permease protein
MQIAGFLLRRLVQAMIVMLAVATIAFFVKDSLGDPLREILGEAVPESERAEMRKKLGLDAPLLSQYASFIGRAAVGDLGASYVFKKPTLEVIASKFPATFELVLGASLIVLLISLPAGLFCALRPRTWLARAIMAGSVLGLSVPVFLTGIFLISIFSVWLGWLPAFGRGPTQYVGPWETGLLSAEGWRYLLLPSLTLSSIMLPLFIRLVRGAMLDELGKDYMRTAHAKGLPPLRVWLAHGLRNALLPIVSIGALQIGSMLAFTILTETVFQWPGMGFLFLEAVTRSDVPLIVAYLVVVAALFVIVNTAADAAGLALDPRAQREGAVR